MYTVFSEHIILIIAMNNSYAQSFRPSKVPQMFEFVNLMCVNPNNYVPLARPREVGHYIEYETISFHPDTRYATFRDPNTVAMKCKTRMARC